jgi:tetratricopeptide (TPR) repeat protein
VATQTDSRKHMARALCLQGEVLAASGRIDDAVARLEDAVRLAERIGARPDLWRCLAALGRARIKRGDDAGAEEAYRRAGQVIESIADGLGQPALQRCFLHAEPVGEVYRALGRTLPFSPSRDPTRSSP